MNGGINLWLEVIKGKKQAEHAKIRIFNANIILIVVFKEKGAERRRGEEKDDEES
jgi:hypothetical protein